MQTAVPSSEEFQQILKAEMASLTPSRRSFVESILISPYQTTLHWEYGKGEPYQAWVFADLKERNVVGEYCTGGFGALGAPWGINFRDADHFGMDSGWYPTIDALLEDWGLNIALSS